MKLVYIRVFSIFAIVVLGTVVYFNSLWCSFHFDDFTIITSSPYIRDIFNLQNIWSWYPCRFIPVFSFALNYHFSQFNVFGYHLFNIAVHLLSAILVWWLTLLTLSTPAFEENSTKSMRLGLFKKAFADEEIGKKP